MERRNRASRRVVVATWLSLVTLLMATFSWLPAAANEGTPPSEGGTGETFETQSLDESNPTTTAAMAVATVTTEQCGTTAGAITGSVTVTDPVDNGNITVELIDPQDKVLNTVAETIVTDSATTSYRFDIQLSDVDVDDETQVTVRATYDGASRSSTAFPIHVDATNAVACGQAPVPPSPTPTATVEPTPTATVTTTPDPTSTTTPTSTPSETPTSTETPTGTATSTPTNTPTATPTDEPTVTYAVVTGTGIGLRCRATPVTGTVLGVYPDGTRLEVRGETENGWAPVKCGGSDSAWMAASYLRFEQGPAPTDPDDGDDGGSSYGSATVVNTGGVGLRCRTAPVDGAIITVMGEGVTIPLRGPVSNGWAPIECAGQDGHASATYLRISTDGGSTPTDPGEDPDDGDDLGGTGTFGTVVNTGTDSLRCRTTAVSGATITMLAPGARAETRGDAVNNWHPVICANQKGWVYGGYFRVDGDDAPTPPPADGGGKMLTVTGTSWSGLRCRTAPVDGGVIGVIPEGGRVETRGALTNGWYPVTCFGQAGWVSATYVMTDSSGGGTGEFWIDINLSTQFMRVYRGNTVINSTYVSTGRPQFATPPGTFYVIRKLPSQTMSGVLGGEYYYVPNVPWVMYFTNRGHAIHGAYWHNNFGNVMSHGCVNLPVGFAEWLYYNTPMYTRIRIHY